VYRKDVCQFQVQKIDFCQNVNVHYDENQRHDWTKDLFIKIFNSSLKMQIDKTLQTNVGYSQINKRKMWVAKSQKKRIPDCEMSFIKY